MLSTRAASGASILIVRRSGAIVIVIVALLTGYVAGGRGQSTTHPPRAQTFQVPKSWGDFKAVYQDQLLFEDQAGTIRSVYPNGTVVVFTISLR
jgi:hypothetical protein